MEQIYYISCNSLKNYLYSRFDCGTLNKPALNKLNNEIV